MSDEMGIFTVALMMKFQNVVDRLEYSEKCVQRSSCDVVINSDTNKNGTIMSPSYPSPYPPKTTCRYEFQGRGKERVQIVFQDFNLYHSSDNPKE
ncbi:hypothetical protein NQ315_012146 [Exocentrus adspersus]|uniref:CUB domain-containing protein n=1 Tax=Exocentrus adspersus TaxID=1586481 RepID=A0AAV8VZD7_9CUCU|nr:hypothetical protein NQ315_012146 [Exocentrus adspersus]